MTGFAQVRGEILRQDVPTSAIAAEAVLPRPRCFFSHVKSVNLVSGLHFRLPSGTRFSRDATAASAQWKKMGRGHVEVSLALETQTIHETFSLNPKLLAANSAFRAAAASFRWQRNPTSNAILRMPGALDSANESADGEIESAVMKSW